jgi:hypothetical protein
MISITSSMFWGIIIILAGILIVLRMFSVFRDLSVFRVIAGLIIIYFGFTLILGKNIIVLKDSKGCFFNYNNTTVRGNEEKYEVIFSNRTIDFSNTANKEIKIVTVFGRTAVKVGKNSNFRINGNVAFGSIKLPDNNNTFLGQINYSSPNPSGEKDSLKINTDVVFGTMEVIKE